MISWLRGIYLAIIYRDVDKEAMAELLEISIKSGRRAAYDLKHAASSLAMAEYRAGVVKAEHDIDFTAEYHARADHYQTIFNAANDMKNYRIRLWSDIHKLESRVNTLEKIIEEHNIRTGENVDKFGPQDIPF